VGQLKLNFKTGRLTKEKKMNAVNYRVNLGFAGYTDADLGDFTDNVIASMTGNPSFPTPPVDMAAVGAQRTAFATAVTNAAQGGTQLTAIKNAARKTLVTILRKIAAYVQSIASQDVALLLSSGFQANSTNRARTPLAVPTILSISNDATTELTVRLQPVDNARAYQVRYSINGGTSWLPIVDSTQARQIILQNLTPGATYTAQSRAVGGSKGYSDWSDPVSHMAM
jgi:hypothetical protein